MPSTMIEGLIDRRILISYRVEPAVAAAQLPSPFTPQVVNGYAVAGICLIRLTQLRPGWCPAVVGLSSENAAHRFAVEWIDAGIRRQGVYIPRRDTSSRINTLLGGRTFPGLHHHARFDVGETASRYHVAVASDDRAVALSIDARLKESWRSALFESCAAASDFYRCGACGYSPTARPHCYEGLELCSEAWEVTPLAVDEVRSNFFDDPRLFPPGSIAFDHALLMRGIPHHWRSLGQLRGANEMKFSTRAGTRAAALTN